MHELIDLGVDPWSRMTGPEMPRVAEVVVPICEGGEGVCEEGVCVRCV